MMNDAINTIHEKNNNNKGEVCVDNGEKRIRRNTKWTYFKGPKSPTKYDTERKSENEYV